MLSTEHWPQSPARGARSSDSPSAFSSVDLGQLALILINPGRHARAVGDAETSGVLNHSQYDVSDTFASNCRRRVNANLHDARNSIGTIIYDPK